MCECVEILSQASVGDKVESFKNVPDAVKKKRKKKKEVNLCHVNCDLTAAEQE